MKLSIIVPVYNSEEYLSECLDSILAQEMTDFEVICVDDESTDNSGKILDEYAAKDPRIKVIHAKHGGVSAARNTGLDNAKGDFIGFVDSDDLIEPNMYSHLLSLADEHGAQVVECLLDRRKKIMNKPLLDAKKVINGYQFCCTLYGPPRSMYAIHVVLYTKVYKRELWNGIRFPLDRYYEDETITYKVCLKAATLVQIYDPLYHYVARGGSITTAPSPKKMVDRIVALADQMDFLAVVVPETKPHIADFMFRYGYQYIYTLLHMGVQRECDEIKDMLVKYKNNLLPYLQKDEAEMLNLLEEGLYPVFYEKYVTYVKKRLANKPKDPYSAYYPKDYFD